MCGDTAAAGSSKILFYYSSSHLGLYQTFPHAVFPSSLALESCLCYDSQISVSQAAHPSQVFSGSRKLYLQRVRLKILYVLGSIFGLSVKVSCFLFFYFILKKKCLWTPLSVQVVVTLIVAAVFAQTDFSYEFAGHCVPVFHVFVWKSVQACAMAESSHVPTEHVWERQREKENKDSLCSNVFPPCRPRFVSPIFLLALN